MLRRYVRDAKQGKTGRGQAIEARGNRCGTSRSQKDVPSSIFTPDGDHAGLCGRVTTNTHHLFTFISLPLLAKMPPMHSPDAPLVAKGAP